MAVRVHPPRRVSPYAQAERDYFPECVKNNGTTGEEKNENERSASDTSAIRLAAPRQVGARQARPFQDSPRRRRHLTDQPKTRTAVPGSPENQFHGPICYPNASSLGTGSEAMAPESQFTRRLNSPKLQILTLQR